MVRYWAKRYLAEEADQWVDATAEALRGADLLVAHPTAATLSAIPAQAARIPWVVGHLFPSMIPSRHTDPAGMNLSGLPEPFARALRRVAWKIAPTMASPIMQDKAINRVRARYDLPPKRGNVMVAWMDADATAVLASPRYTPPRADWPDRVTSTGFTPWSGPPGAELDPEIESHLAAGEPPVLVTMGTSTATIAGPILRDTAAALDRLGHRGLFLVGTDENQQALDDVDGVFRFAPLGQVLDRCQAVVHQCGHGTVTATIHAGLPSVALPMGFDQIAHGRRLTELGVGTMVSARGRGVHSIASAIASILDDEVRHRARSFAAALRLEKGTAATCDLIEEILDHAA
jgi:UDP:flavonoid glycosyltransferase YjiC (YdhE family)